MHYQAIMTVICGSGRGMHEMKTLKTLYRRKCEYKSINILELILILLIVSSCAKQSSSDIVIVPKGTSHDLVVISTVREVTVFYPIVSGNVTSCTFVANETDRPFFDLWKKYASIPDAINLLSYKSSYESEDQIETYGSSNIIGRKFGDSFIMEVDLSSDFKDYLINANTLCEDCLMESLVKTLLYNESSSLSDNGFLYLTLDGDPFVFDENGNNIPLTTSSFDHSQHKFK